VAFSYQIKERVRQERAECMLEVAAEMFMKNRSHGASLDEVIAHAGVAKGALYQHVVRQVDLARVLQRERGLPLCAQTSERTSAFPSELAPDEKRSSLSQQRGYSPVQLTQVMFGDSKAGGLCDATISTELLTWLFWHMPSLSGSAR
jgi:hypothetical protein